jgi:DNA-binding MarR family transcriptional regulator
MAKIKRASKLTSSRGKSEAAANAIAGATGEQPDPINTIVSQWQRERPDIDSTPMLLFGLIAHTQAVTTNFINDVLEKWHISRSSFDVLATLRRAGAPYCLTPKQLSQSLMLSGAGMTSRLDRLEELLLVARLPDANDRRSVNIQLTDRGVRLVNEMIPDFVAAQRAAISKLNARERDDLIRLLKRFAQLLTRPS